MHKPGVIKILLVDDRPANLLSLEAVLTHEDYDLTRASSGAEAIRLVEKESFATILLDVQMPGMDGYETARRIKVLPNGKDTPIIFVTAVYTEDEDARRGYEAGGLDYFAKPIDPDLLRTKVRIYADLFRMTRAKAVQDRLISALKERELAERALDQVLQSVSDGVLIADARGTFSRSNEEARSLWCAKEGQLGSVADLHGRGRWAASGREVERHEWALAKALATGTVCMNDAIVIRCLDGTKKTVVESASPLIDEDGSVAGAVLVIKPVPRHGPPLELEPPRGAVRPSPTPH